MSRIVVALGGNALGNTYKEQMDLIGKSSHDLIKLFHGNEVVVCHGNGPQVGMITKALTEDDVNMPLDCCTAMSQGYIGFHIQRILKQRLMDNNNGRDVVTLVTEVIVDPNDKSFKKPSKPIGNFYTKEEAQKLSKESGDKYIEDAGRGYRKVVASPKPVDIINLDVMENLLSKDTIIVAGGGGGIPVTESHRIKKVEAVIDKDLVASLLAQKLNADKFIILTAVDQVMINFGKKNEKGLDRLSIKDAKKYMKKKEFKEGSMLPKIKAAVQFVEKTGNEAIITSLSNINGVIDNKKITIIYK